MMSHTRNLKLVILLLLTIIALALSAIYLHTPETEGAGPDLNGYTAQYECRAGNPNCNVDIDALTTASCDQTITTATTPTNDWSAINWANNVICIEAGDHVGRGILYLGSSGTSGARKVLRYYRSGDNNDEPWNQGANQAKLRGIDSDGRDYWIIHRLTIDPNFIGRYNGIWIGVGSSGNIINRILGQRTWASVVVISGTFGYPPPNGDNVIQNSVIRTTKTPIATPTDEYQGINVSNMRNTYIVNNEVYDVNKGVQVGENSSNHGLVVENNDLYLSPAGKTDCAGNYDVNGACGVMEGLFDVKPGAHCTETEICEVIHNRLWDMRWSDGNLIQNGDGVSMVMQGNWYLFQNNIITGSDVGAWNYYGGVGFPKNNSFIGNLLYDIWKRRVGHPGEKGAIVNWDADYYEYYLNTVIRATEVWLEQGYGGNTDNDFRCNVIIDSAAKNGNGGSGTQLDHNVYYSTPGATDTTNIDNPLTTRGNVTPYSVNQIIRLSSTPTTSCTSATDSDCFLYKVTQAGTSASSQPSYCTTANCITTDGGMKVQAIRGPYTFYRKLKTSPELFTIPYATPFSSAPESGFCPTSTGTRGGVGISDAGIF